MFSGFGARSQVENQPFGLILAAVMMPWWSQVRFWRFEGRKSGWIGEFGGSDRKFRGGFPYRKIKFEGESEGFGQISRETWQNFPDRGVSPFASMGQHPLFLSGVPRSGPFGGGSYKADFALKAPPFSQPLHKGGEKKAI